VIFPKIRVQEFLGAQLPNGNQTKPLSSSVPEVEDFTCWGGFALPKKKLMGLNTSPIVEDFVVNMQCR
jgi:hypothetical protein